MTLVVVAGLAVLAFLLVAWPLLRRPLAPALGEAAGPPAPPQESADEMDVQLGLLAPGDRLPAAGRAGEPRDQGASTADMLAELEMEVAALRQRRAQSAAHVCARCAAQLQEADRFCRRCGNPVAGAP